jgi:hypothetical protein
LRAGLFNPNHLRDASRVIARWRQPNGLMRAMDVGMHHYIGYYNEAMGVTAPLQELMLQSWDGAIRVFSCWPDDLPASFTTLRAEGAFLVSAAWRDGQVQSLAIESERGKRCRIVNPWDDQVTVTITDGKTVETTVEEDNVICFDTTAGLKYEVKSV